MDISVSFVLPDYLKINDMSNESHSHIVPYRIYVFVLLGLVTLTFTSVFITHIDLGKVAIVGALLIASIKSSLVLWHFMHLKYENRLIITMVGLVLFVFAAMLILTFLDYRFRH
jgi:cytochrome c oxidase subunit 4